MKRAILSVTLLLVAAPFATQADIRSEDLPAGTIWYLHADFERMRSTDAGGKLYAWLHDEIIVEVNDELSIDLNEEVDRITAFSNDGSSVIAIVEGPLSRDLRDRVLEAARLEGSLEQYSHSGKTYYRVGDEDSTTRTNDGDPIPHTGYFTFEVPGKLLVASEQGQMQALIDNNGRVAGAGAGGGAMLVLSADKQFVQAGMRTAQFADSGGDWESNILRNTEQAALLISDKDGMLAIAAKLVSSDAELTQSLASIVNGVIALQAFSGELDPQLADVLRNTRVEVDGQTLSVSTVIAPDVVMQTLLD